MELLFSFSAFSRAVKINLIISCNYGYVSDLINKSFQYVSMDYWLYRRLLVLKDCNGLFLLWSICELAMRLGAVYD